MLIDAVNLDDLNEAAEFGKTLTAPGADRGRVAGEVRGPVRDPRRAKCPGAGGD
jgi:hypothetical protein